MSPGTDLRVTVPPCAATIASTSDSPRPTPTSLPGCGRRRRGRTARRRARPAPAGSPARRRGRRTRRRRTRDGHGRAGRGVPRALVSRFVTTWCSRSSSPTTSTASHGVVGQRRAATGGPAPTTRASETASRSSRVRSTGSRSSGRPESSRASSSRSSTSDGHPAGLLLDLVERGAERGRVVGSPAGQLGVAGDGRQRACAARARRRRRTAAPAARCGAARPATPRRGEQRVQRGADLADLGALVGEVLGHPRRSGRSRPRRQRQLGDRVRGRGDLAQRPQLAAYDDQRRRPRPPATPSSASSDLPARSGWRPRRRPARSAGRRPGRPSPSGVGDHPVASRRPAGRPRCTSPSAGTSVERRRGAVRSSSRLARDDAARTGRRGADLGDAASPGPGRAVERARRSAAAGAAGRRLRPSRSAGPSAGATSSSSWSVR